MEHPQKSRLIRQRFFEGQVFLNGLFVKGIWQDFPCHDFPTEVRYTEGLGGLEDNFAGQY